MSQSDTDFENETKAFMDVVMSNLPASQNRIELIKTESANDEICRDILKSNLIRRILKRCILAGNFAKSFVLSNDTKGLWSVLNLVPIK
jgi:hypothetical protein